MGRTNPECVSQGRARRPGKIGGLFALRGEAYAGLFSSDEISEVASKRGDPGASPLWKLLHRARPPRVERLQWVDAGLPDAGNGAAGPAEKPVARCSGSGGRITF
jgi:hypothetical protein